MPQVKQSAAGTIVVQLVSSTDGVTPVTGKTGADVTATFLKADGTFQNYAATATLTEATTGAFASAGVYLLTVPSAATSVIGQLPVAVSCTGARTYKSELLEVVANIESDTYARLGAPAGASVSADVAAVKSDTAAIYARQGAPAGASQSADVAAVKTVVDTISTSAGASLGSNVSAIKTKTDNLPTDPADASDVAAAITAATSPLATSLALTTVGSNVTSIKAKTDNLPSDPADESTLEGLLGGISIDLTPVTSAIAALSATLVDVPSGVLDVQDNTARLLQTAVGRKTIALDGDDYAWTVYDEDAETPLYKLFLYGPTGDPTPGPAIWEVVPQEIGGGGGD